MRCVDRAEFADDGRRWPYFQCLLDFRKLWRRQKAFEGGAENGVRVGVAAGRAVEFGERERGAQFETAGLLALGDGDGGKVGVFGGVEVCRVFLEEKVATRAVDLCVKPALSCAIKVLKRLMDCCQSGFGLTISRFRFRQSRPDERLKGPDAILLKQGSRPAHVQETSFRGARSQFHPGFQEGPESDPKGDSMLVGETGKLFDQRRGAVDIPADNLEHDAMHQPHCRGFEVCPSSAMRLTVASASFRARSISPSGQSTIAR